MKRRKKTFNLTNMADEPKASTSEETKKAESECKIKELKFPSSEKCNEILNKLQASREDGAFCDVQLKFSPVKTVYAHKSILAICSPYFEGMFASSFVEATSEVVDLSHMCDRSDVLELVLDTFYGRQFVINENNVSDVLNLASMLLLDDLKVECSKVLLGVLALHNAAEMLQLAINYEIDDLLIRVEQIVRARFHDCILFQEDLYHLTVQGFDFLLDIIDTSFITRREAYVQFILKWYNQYITEERAHLLMKAIKEIGFKLTKHSYVEYKNALEDVLNHLDDANTALIEQTKMELRITLVQLIPIDYVENIPLSNDAGDSDVEMEPEFVMFPEEPDGKKPKCFGPPTKQTGFTRAEEEQWRKADAEMAERDRHRRLREQWPPSTRKDPNRPKGIQYESDIPVLRTRKFEIKSPSEQARFDKMVEAVIVIAPSTSYIDKIRTVKAKESWREVRDGTLIISAYVPCTKAWYKICEISSHSITDAFSAKKYKGREVDYDEDDEEEMHMMFMGMPDDMMPRHSRRMMKEMARAGDMPPRMMREMMRGGGMPSRMMRDMMDMDHMMMMEMGRNHPRHGSMMHRMLPFREVRPLSDKRWKMQYLNHKLLCIHPDYLNTVFCYDIVSQEWSQIFFDYRSRKPVYESYEIISGIDSIIMGDQFFAVLRVAFVDRKDFDRYKRPDEIYEASMKQTVTVRHVLYKLIVENNKMRLEEHMVSSDNHVYLEIDKQYRDKGEEKSPFHDNRPRIRQPDALDTVLFAENPYTLYIAHVKHDRSYKCERACHSINNLEALYLDVKESEVLYHGCFHELFSRTIHPLVSEDVVGFVNDHLTVVAAIDLTNPSNKRGSGFGAVDIEEHSKFLDALEKSPQCPSITCSSNDGKRFWILNGNEDNSSETIEVTATYRRHIYGHDRTIHQKNHTPPPFRTFTLGTVGKMDLSMIKTFGLPLKYMQEDGIV